MIDSLGEIVSEYYGMDRKSFVGYKGEGTLVLEEHIELNCQFKAKQFTDGETLLICNISPSSIHQIDIEEWKTDSVFGDSLEGRTTDGKIVKTIIADYGQSLIQDDPLVVAVIFNPKQIEIGAIDVEPIDSILFGITNFLFKGNPFEHQNYAEFIDFDFGGIKATILKNKEYDLISEFMKIRGKQHITCELCAKVSNEADINIVEEQIGKLCYVLSVGCGSKVQWIFYSVYAKGFPVYTRHILVPNKSFNSQVIIDAERHTSDWTNFINIAFPRYLKSIECFGEINGIPRINAAIDVFTDARIYSDFIHAKGIKLAITMEMIKEMFKTAWIPEEKILGGRTRKDMEKEIKETLEPVLVKYYKDEQVKNALEKIYQINRVSFETILNHGLKKINFNPDQADLNRFIKNRDYLVHQGRFYSETVQEGEGPDYADDYIFISNFLTGVFLAILGYRGHHGEIYITKHSL